MANYSAIKAAVNAYIKQNGKKEITGHILNSVLNATIDSLGRYYQFAGGAMPTDDPGTPDQNVCYLAGEPGVYTNFGGITIENEEVALLFWNGEWTKQRVLLGIQEVEASVDNQVGTPSVDVSYSGGQLVLTFHNLKGEQGAAAGFGTIGADINGGVGTPGVSVESSGSNTAKNIMFHFTNLKGETGVTSVVATIDDTSGTPSCQVSLVNGVLTLAFSGLKGLKGDTGVSADYPITIYNGLDSDATDQALAAAQGKVLDGKISQLRHEVDGINTILTGTVESGKYITASGGKGDNSSFKIVGFDLSGYSKIFVQVPAAASQSTPYYCFFTSTAMSTPVGAATRTNSLAGNTTEMTVPTGATCLGISIVSTQDPVVSVIVRGLTGRVEVLETKMAGVEGRLDDAEVEIEEGKKIYGIVLESERTVNLFNRNFVEDGKYINNNGTISNGSGWAVSPMIPVTAGEKYLISCKTSGRDYGVSWYDENGDLLSGGSATIYGVQTAPSGAYFLRFNVASNNTYSTEVMVIHGETPVPYVPYNQITPNKVNGLDAFVRNVVSDGELSIEKNGNEITVNSGANYIKAKLENNSGNTYGANPVFDFTKLQYGSMISTNSDEIAPVHILRTTIGANHGQPCQLATVTGHGLDNTSIGTEWLDGNGVKFYIMRIVDADKIVFLSENTGTLSAPQFVALVAGTLTKGADTLTVTSVTASQLYPALKNHFVKLMVDGKDEISSDGTYSAKFLDVVEEYGIMHPVSTLQKIIARAGESSDPDYDGDEAVRIKNIYRFCGNLCVLVIATVIPVQDVALSDIMFAQAAKMATDTIKYYIPNSLPLGGGLYDFRKPLSVNWSSSVPSLFVGTSQMADTDNPVNRVVQYDEAKNVGFALGYVRGFGVAKDLLDYTTESFEIRNNSGKVYPHGVSYGKVGGTLHPGMIYQAVMYRSPFPFTSIASGQMSMYHFPFDGAEYVFVDYASSVLDNVKVDSSLNGKSIEVIEAVNTELVTDIYNDGFLVNATYVENETCYIVVKIK